MSVYIVLAQLKTIYAAFSPYDYQSSGFIQPMFVACQLCDEPSLRAWDGSLNRTWIVEIKMG